MKQKRPFPPRRFAWTAIAGLAMATIPASADPLSLSAIFSDHMVLQRGTRLPVWGRAAPGGGWVPLTPEIRPLLPALMTCTSTRLHRNLKMPAGIADTPE